MHQLQRLISYLYLSLSLELNQVQGLTINSFAAGLSDASLKLAGLMESEEADFFELPLGGGSGAELGESALLDGMPEADTETEFPMGEGDEALADSDHEEGNNMNIGGGGGGGQAGGVIQGNNFHPNLVYINGI